MTHAPNSPRLASLRPLLRVLASGRLAITLLVLYVVWYVLSMVFPQRGLESDAAIAEWIALYGGFGSFADSLDLIDLKRSWLLFTTHQLLFVNLVVCMMLRARPMWLASRRPTHVPNPAAFKLARTLPADTLSEALSLAAVQRVLKRRRFAVVTDGDAVYGLKGRFAYAGHFLFHVGFVVLLVVGGGIAFAPDPFRGTVGLGEGEPFSLHDSPFLGANRPIDDTLPALEFQLQELSVETFERTTTEFEARLVTPERTQTVRVNDPYRHGPYQVVPQGFGFMPGWVLVRRGQMVGGAWLKLVPFPNEYRETIILGEDGVVDLIFLPHRVEDGEFSVNADHALENPYFLVTARWKDKEVYSGWLAPGEPVHLEPGVVFYFTPEIRHWVIFDIVEEQGHWGVFASFGIILLGLVLRYARVRKEVRVELLADGDVDLRGDTEILESLFGEELDALAAELASQGKASTHIGERG